MPRGPGWRRPRLVTRETADLCRALASPGTVPAGMDTASLAGLVLDGLLELDAGGGYLSGPAAHPIWFPDPEERSEAAGVIARLSSAAVSYAGALRSSRLAEVAARLYRFNTSPRTPRWERALGSEALVERLVAAGDPEARLAAGRLAEESTNASNAWRSWRDRGAATPEPGEPVFKLYVSPRPDAVEAAWREITALSAEPDGPFALKLGRDLPNLLRPDKLVLYFATRPALDRAADRLRPRLAGLPAQGVPFTAALDRSGLLSWGVDPGDAAEPPGPARQRSWRAWITARLGGAIATAVAADAPVRPHRFALDRIRLDGVDPADWAPPPHFEAAAA